MFWCNLGGLGGVWETSLTTRGVIVDKLIHGVDVVLGIDVIDRLGGVVVFDGRVQFGVDVCAAAVGNNVAKNGAVKTDAVSDVEHEVGGLHRIEDKDFLAEFDGKHWTVSYYWRGGVAPVLRNTVDSYSSTQDGTRKAKFQAKVDRWIEEGILLPWKREEGGLLPLMAVAQPTKNKVRPVLESVISSKDTTKSPSPNKPKSSRPSLLLLDYTNIPSCPLDSLTPLLPSREQ